MHNVKKRRRKDLRANEIEKIVAATKIPYRFQKDVAREFNITDSLVSALVVDSERRPDKLRAKRRKDGLKIIQKDAIAEVTNSILETGQPIVSVS